MKTTYNLEYVRFNARNFNTNSLDDFVRYQKVTHCWRFNGNEYVLSPVEYTEEWDLTELRELASRILSGLNNEHIAFGAVDGGKIAGFAILDVVPFGTRKQYLDLAEFYVSAPYRRCGIGKKLFATACDAAKELGAEKLYISAHSARESITAYKSYGCSFAKEINTRLAEKEPFDLQLEYVLK